MPIILNKTGIVCKLEDKIKYGKHVFLLDYDDSDLLRLLCDGLQERGISDVEIWHCIQRTFDCDIAKHISRDEMKAVLEIYSLYDFSDKVSVISDAVQYGTLFNYLRNGVLTKKELTEALLYKI